MLSVTKFVKATYSCGRGAISDRYLVIARVAWLELLIALRVDVLRSNSLRGVVRRNKDPGVAVEVRFGPLSRSLEPGIAGTSRAGLSSRRALERRFLG